MRKLGSVLVILLVLCLVWVPTALADEVPQSNVIETTATGSIDVQPDLVTLGLSVRTEDTTSALAQADNAQAVNNVINSLVNEGINKDDIKTTNYWTYSYTKTTKDNSSSEVTVYAANSSLTVTSQDLSLVGDVLGVLANIAQVNVDSVNYSLQNPDQYRSQVIAAAIDAAKQNIQASASALGLGLNKLVYLKVDYSPSPNDNIYHGVNSALSAAAVPQPQNPGPITLTATADMSYSVN